MNTQNFIQFFMPSEYVGKGINNMKLIITALVLRIEPLHSLSNSLETVTRCIILLLHIFYSCGAGAQRGSWPPHS